jgi:prepilin-type N-terminal cleavage/methylation domain-containing protein
LINNQKGFTLVEIIAVLIILSILAVIAVPRFINMNVGDKMTTQVMSELSAREKMTWMNIRLASLSDDTTVDDMCFNAMSYEIGATWVSGPNKSGGTVVVDNATTILKRTHATQTEPATWSR